MAPDHHTPAPSKEPDDPVRGLSTQSIDKTYETMNREDEAYLRQAAVNQRRAHDIIRQSGIIEAWEASGAEVRSVGSLRMGLLAAHRDIDFHIYSDELSTDTGFEAMKRLARCTAIEQIEFRNLISTDEECVEWHAWYRDDSNERWQIDMIHIRRGSRYDGYFEQMADRIVAALTPQTHATIVRLKFQTPHNEKILGIEYYRAVLEGNVESVEQLKAWRQAHPVEGVVEWMP